MHASRSGDRTADTAFAVEQPAAQPGADHIDIAQNHWRAGSEADGLSGIEAQTVRLLDAVNDRRQKSFRFRNAKFIKYLRPIVAGAVIAKSEIGFRRITCAFPCEFEIKPVLAVMGGLGLAEEFGRVTFQPGELDILL